MLTVLIGDVMAAARLLCATEATAAPRLLDRLIAEAHAAHLYRKRTGRGHPVWGNGSLMARAAADGCPREMPLSDARYLACMALVTERLAERRAAPGADCRGTPPHASMP